MSTQTDVRTFIAKVQARNYGTGNPAPVSEVKTLNAEWAAIKAALPANEQSSAGNRVHALFESAGLLPTPVASTPVSAKPDFDDSRFGTR